MSHLTEKEIKKGCFLWYGGRMSLCAWSCPAVITKVNHRDRTFLVMSLDDMKEQDQVYAFDVFEHSPESRRSMRRISSEEVREYLAQQEREIRNRVSEAQENLKRAKKLLKKFQEQKAKLLL